MLALALSLFAQSTADPIQWVAKNLPNVSVQCLAEPGHSAGFGMVSDGGRYLLLGNGRLINLRTGVVRKYAESLATGRCKLPDGREFFGEQRVLRVDDRGNGLIAFAIAKPDPDKRVGILASIDSKDRSIRTRDLVEWDDRRYELVHGQAATVVLWPRNELTPSEKYGPRIVSSESGGRPAWVKPIEEAAWAMSRKHSLVTQSVSPSHRKLWASNRYQEAIFIIGSGITYQQEVNQFDTWTSYRVVWWGETVIKCESNSTIVSSRTRLLDEETRRWVDIPCTRLVGHSQSGKYLVVVRDKSVLLQSRK